MVDTAIRHGKMMLAWKGERSAVLEMRKHLCWYIHGKRGAAQMRTRITAVDTMEEVLPCCGILPSCKKRLTSLEVHVILMKNSD